MKLKIFLIFLFANTTLFAQHDQNITYGIKFGGLQQRISNLPEMIIGRDNSLANYTIDNKGSYGVEGGLFLNYKLSETRVGIQTEILYRKAGDHIDYKNSIGKEYQIDISYSYLMVGGIYKVYPFDGFNFGLGTFYGVNLTPANLEYTSNEFDGQFDVATRQFYRDGINGKDDFSIAFSLGYELKKYLHCDLRYYLGVSDVIKSGSNSFQFIENKNQTSTLSFSLGYSLHEW